MHNRGGSRDIAKQGGANAGDSLQRLKRLDIYASPKQEFQRSTLHGAIVSVVLAVIVTVLTWRELIFSMRKETVERLFVNSTINPTVNVTFDVVFSRISCSMVSLDAEDSLGMTQENLKHDVTRTRLDLEGRPLAEGEKHAMGNTLKEIIAKEQERDSAKAEKDDKKEGKGKSESEDNAEDECNCYGAGSEGECCRSCQDVKAAYRRRGWKLDPTAVPVCGGDAANPISVFGTSADSGNEGNEGCRLKGSIQVTKTEGNFHFAPGHRLHRNANALTLMDRIQVALEAFNTTHTIHTLSFGDQPPPEHASAASTVLEGHQRTVQDTHAMHQYFLHLVPTVYRLANGKEVHSNQYSVTEHLKHVAAGPSSELPGVYFHYEVSPVQALVEESSRGFLAFLTGACGVVGGVYTILGLVNTGIDGFLAGKGRHRLR